MRPDVCRVKRRAPREGEGGSCRVSGFGSTSGPVSSREQWEGGDDSAALAALAAELEVHIPLRARLVRATPFFHPVQKHRAAFRLVYDGESACHLAERSHPRS